MNVLFVSEGTGHPSAYYRCELAAQGLRANGVHAVTSRIMAQVGSGRLCGVHADGKLMSPVPDVVVLRRMVDRDREPIGSAGLIREARRTGQRVWMDIDDDMWNIPAWNPAVPIITDRVRELWVEDANASNGVLCSTNVLAGRVRDKVDTAVVVCENSVDPAIYTPNYTEHRPIRLGWLGSLGFRWPDLEWLAPILADVLPGRDVEFWHCGSDPFKTGELRALLGDPPYAIHEQPWIDADHLPRVMAKLDSVIIPQLPIPFNEARSATIGLACMAAGVCYVASPTPTYERMWMMGAGYLADTPDDWAQSLRMLIEPEYFDARRSITNGGLAVAHKHAPHLIAKQYLQVFR